MESLPDYPVSSADYIIRFFNLRDFVEGTRCTDGAVITLQHYLDGYSWICHYCCVVGTDGLWLDEVVGPFAREQKRGLDSGSLNVVRIDASLHARELHGTPDIFPRDYTKPKE